MSQVEELKNIDFTLEDFDLLNEGLKAIPNAMSSGGMMADLLASAMIPNDDEDSKFSNMVKTRKSEREKEIESKDEACTLLRGKIIRLKRFLIEKDLLSEATNYLTNS